MRIAITGSTGLIGTKLIAYFNAQHHHVVSVTRQKDLKTPSIVWDPDAGQINPAALEGFDAVIHLAGTNIGERWTKEYKQSILESRVNATRTLCQALAAVKQKPKVLLSASAVGYYGNHAPHVILDENSPSGGDFLAQVCRRWEEETKPAAEAGIRVVNTRFGVVLSKSGGALAKMWLPFQLGIGGVLGDGHQMMSWVAVDEIPLILMHLINHPEISGPVNVVSPDAVDNQEFTKILGSVIKRPTFLPVPSLAIKLLFGEMGQTLLLEGNHAVPKRLKESGYKFKYADIREALEKAIA